MGLQPHDETRPLQAEAEPGPQSSPVKGRLVGRYVLLEKLGSGGSGEVYAAFDPVLDRRVAVKLLRNPVGSTSALVREGRMLAKLVHPSVVAVHDSGVDEGRAYLAMELAGGEDILSFARQARAQGRFEELLAAIRSAGEGLAAAHRVGLVHGDVKPSNILRDDEGRTKLSDFGIALLRELGSDDELSARGGTPAFMAPEQYERGTATAGVDQYAFCLTAWVLLHGAHPFASSLRATTADDEADLSASDSGACQSDSWTADDDLTRWADAQRHWTPNWTSKAPHRVGAALRRGLDLDPAARWESMDALLVALRPSPARRRLWPAVAITAVASLAGAAGLDAQSEPSPCAHSGDAVAQAWNDERAQQLEDAWSSGESAFGKTRERVVRDFDEYARRWATTSAQVCEATHVHETQSTELLDLRGDCLRSARVSLEEAIDVLTVDDANVWAEATWVVAALPDLSACPQRRPSPAWARYSDDLETRPRVDAVDRLLERARLSLDAGVVDRASTALLEARPEVEALDIGPLWTAYWNQRSRLLDWQGDSKQAIELAKRALHSALRFDQRNLAMNSGARLAHLVSRDGGRPAEGLDYAHLILALAQRPTADDSERALAHSALGGVLGRRGEFEAALEHQGLEIELMEREYGPDSPEVATSRNDRATTLHDAGRLQDALVEHEAALAAREAVFGPDHPMVAQSHHNLSVLYRDLADPRSEHHTRLALDALIAAHGPHQARVAMTQASLGDDMRHQGRPREALELYEPAVDTLSDLIDADNPDTAVVRASLGVTLAMLGRFDEAEPQLQRALTDTRRALGENHPYTARATLYLGAMYRRAQRYDDAATAYAAASACYERGGTPLHPGRVGALVGLGDVERSRGAIELAAEHYTTAESILDRSEQPQTVIRAALDRGLGEVAWRQGRWDEAAQRLDAAADQLERGRAAPSRQAEVALLRAKVARAREREPAARAYAERAQVLARTIAPELGTGLRDEIDAWLKSDSE